MFATARAPRQATVDESKIRDPFACDALAAANVMMFKLKLLSSFSVNRHTRGSVETQFEGADRMAKKSNHHDSSSNYEREQRSVVIRSSLTGVAATVVAVTMCSSAGLAGFVGNSAADSLDGAMSPDALSARDGGPAFPEMRVPLSSAELAEIRSRLQSSGAELDHVRENTDAAIEMLRVIAEGGASDESTMANARSEDIELARLLMRESERG